MTININELCKLAQAALVAPDGLSAEWMDRLGQFQEFVSPAVISELLDRLEAAEKERDRYKLAYNEWIAKTEWLRHEIARSSLPAKYLGMHRADAIKLEIDRLRARVAEVTEMEQQEPVAWAATDETCRVVEALGFNKSKRFDTPLYFAPGAKGEEK